MQDKERRLIEALCSGNPEAIRQTLADALDSQDEDILVTVIREAGVADRLAVGSEIATTVSETIVGLEPRHSFLARIAIKLSTATTSQEFIEWLDNILASDIHLSITEFYQEWSESEFVKEIREAFVSSA